MAQPTYEELMAENAKLKAAQEKPRGEVSFKVSEKGALSVYGLGRFPVTLYQEQWRKLLDQADAIRDFLDNHKDKLKVKD